jgi:hypothetical protein
VTNFTSVVSRVVKVRYSLITKLCVQVKMKAKMKIKVKAEIFNQREVVRVAHIGSLAQGDTSHCWSLVLVLGVVFVLCQFTFYQDIDIPVCG